MTYLEAIQYLESLVNYEKIPFFSYKESVKLERIKEFLRAVGNPQDAIKGIHIAGTKGKGSTCAFIAYILRQAGFKVGLYTSPHLCDFRERIRILNPVISKKSAPFPIEFEGMIFKRELSKLVARLKPEIEKYNNASQYGQLSFFEVYTCLAFIYFKENKVDFVVLETGLGGRLDATNVIAPLVSAITPISYEHTDKLGNTFKEIAFEKAGIIKNSSIVITAPQVYTVMKVIRQKCNSVGARLYELNKDIIYGSTDKVFTVKGVLREYPNLKINLLGAHQLINATVAIGVIEALSFFNINIGIDSLRRGLYNTVWPGRCEIIAKNPLVVLDGAQNIASVQCIKKTTKEYFHYKKLILVLGISKDKDIKGIVRQLSTLADVFVITEANNPRAAEAEFIEKIIKKEKINTGKLIIKTKNVNEARRVSRLVSEKDDLILACGSLFVVGEFRNVELRHK